MAITASPIALSDHSFSDNMRSYHPPFIRTEQCTNGLASPRSIAHYADMALLSDLVAICAEHRVDTEATLTLFARRLREAGRVSKAGRGRGAAKMTFLDGARFLIACAATDHPERAADAESAFSALINAGREISFGKGKGDHEGDGTLLDASLAEVLSSIADGSLDAALRQRGFKYVVETPLQLSLFRSAAACNLEAGGAILRFAHPTMADMMANQPSTPDDPRMQAYEQETLRFRTGKNLSAELNSDLLRAVAHAISGTKQPDFLERSMGIGPEA